MHPSFEKVKELAEKKEFKRIPININIINEIKYKTILIFFSTKSIGNSKNI